MTDAPQPQPQRGRIAGPTPRARATRLAGALAELGIQRLTLVYPDGAREEFIARRTDLPGLLALTPRGMLRAHEPDLTVRFSPREVEWQTEDPAAAAHLRQASSTDPNEPNPNEPPVT